MIFEKLISLGDINLTVLKKRHLTTGTRNFTHVDFSRTLTHAKLSKNAQVLFFGESLCVGLNL